MGINCEKGVYNGLKIGFYLIITILLPLLILCLIFSVDFLSTTKENLFTIAALIGGFVSYKQIFKKD